MPRQLADWITAFLDYAEPWNSGPLYKEWAGMWAVGTATTRQVQAKIGPNNLASNLFSILIGSPGAGKSQAIDAARSVFLPATGFSLLPASTTRAGMEDFMEKNLKTRRAPDGSQVPSNEAIALSDEMQGILPEQDISHLTLYNELYNLKGVHRAQTRSRGEVTLQLPYCSIITGAQPGFLQDQLPENAWGMGFMSRSIMIFDAPTSRKDAFEMSDINHTLKGKLIADLKEIKNLYGWMQWDARAKQLYRTWWVEQGGPPIPSNKRLAMGYNARRDQHFFKLAMIYSLSRSSDLVVTIEDAAKAIDLLTRTEARMRHIFAEMTSTGAIAAYGDVIDAVKTAGDNGMAEADLIGLLMDRYPPTQVNALIENLIQSEVVREKPGAITGRGFRRFYPGRKLGVG